MTWIWRNFGFFSLYRFQLLLWQVCVISLKSSKRDKNVGQSIALHSDYHYMCVIVLVYKLYQLTGVFSRVNGSSWTNTSLVLGLIVFTACTTTSDCKHSNYTVHWNPFEFVLCEDPIWRTCTAGYCVCDKTLVTHSYA